MKKLDLDLRRPIVSDGGGFQFSNSISCERAREMFDQPHRYGGVDYLTQLIEHIREIEHRSGCPALDPDKVRALEHKLSV